MWLSPPGTACWEILGKLWKLCGPGLGKTRGLDETILKCLDRRPGTQTGSCSFLQLKGSQSPSATDSLALPPEILLSRSPASPSNLLLNRSAGTAKSSGLWRPSPTWQGTLPSPRMATGRTSGPEAEVSWQPWPASRRTRSARAAANTRGPRRWPACGALLKGGLLRPPVRPPCPRVRSPAFLLFHHCLQPETARGRPLPPRGPASQAVCWRGWSVG